MVEFFGCVLERLDLECTRMFSFLMGHFGIFLHELKIGLYIDYILIIRIYIYI